MTETYSTFRTFKMAGSCRQPLVHFTETRSAYTSYHSIRDVIIASHIMILTLFWYISCSPTEYRKDCRRTLTLWRQCWECSTYLCCVMSCVLGEIALRLLEVSVFSRVLQFLMTNRSVDLELMWIVLLFSMRLRFMAWALETGILSAAECRNKSLYLMEHVVS